MDFKFFFWVSHTFTEHFIAVLYALPSFILNQLKLNFEPYTYCTVLLIYCWARRNRSISTVKPPSPFRSSNLSSVKKSSNYFLFCFRTKRPTSEVLYMTTTIPETNICGILSAWPLKCSGSSNLTSEILHDNVTWPLKWSASDRRAWRLTNLSSLPHSTGLSCLWLSS
jgi:hypothetical protein